MELGQRIEKKYERNIETCKIHMNYGASVVLNGRGPGHIENPVILRIRESGNQEKINHSGITRESGNTEGPAILVWPMYLEILKDQPF